MLVRRFLGYGSLASRCTGTGSTEKHAGDEDDEELGGLRWFDWDDRQALCYSTPKQPAFSFCTFKTSLDWEEASISIPCSFNLFLVAFATSLC